MAQDLLHSRPPFGRTFTLSLGILGLALAIQILAVGWAILTRPALPGPGPGPGPAPAPALPPAAPAAVLAPPTALPAASPEAAGAPGTTESAFPPAPPLLQSGAPAPAPVSLPLPTGGGLPTALAPTAPPETAPAPAALIALPEEPALGPRPETGPAPLAATVPEADSPQPVLSTLLSEAALAAAPALGIPDPEVSGLVGAGSERRASGDMQGALDALRRAEAVLPEHPRVLSEIAATYAEMGLDRKASLYWERVRDLGPEAAGAWHGIALGELSGRRALAAPPPRHLRLGKIQTLHDPAIREDQGERVVLSVSVEADSPGRPSASDMSMRVYFYDLVDGERAEASTADTSQKFTTPPYDWAGGGTETIEVIYHQPVFTPEQKRELGERAFYGYIIELYYRDELQDSAAFPPDLKSLHPGSIPSPMTESPIGPENSLFPTVPPEE